MEKSKEITLIYQALMNAKDTIAIVESPKGKTYCERSDFKDDKIYDYYIQLTDMLIELADRNVMPWQHSEA